MQLTKDILEIVTQNFPSITFLNRDLKSVTRWKVGGVAQCFIEPRSIEELQRVLIFFNQKNLNFLVIGSTTNLLFCDEKLDVPIIQITNKLSSYRVNDKIVKVESGIWVPHLAKKLADSNLSGCEHICGIPGTLGGLVYMNGGSQRKGIGNSIKSVTTISNSGCFNIYSHDDCCFEYRKSIFQKKNEIIVEVELELAEKPSKLIKSEMREILASRRNKFPSKLPNCGSVFVSNPAMYEQYGPPGKVIEESGLKGLKKGGAEISRMHANFIVNNNSATASDILFLIHKARVTVAETTGYKMDSEAIYINSNGEMTPAHIKANEVWGSLEK